MVTQLQEHTPLHDQLYIAMHENKREVESRGHKWDVADALSAVEMVLLETLYLKEA